MRGRTILFTINRPGTYSSSSVTSSPNRFRSPPHLLQLSPGVRIFSLRSRCLGKGLRFGLFFGSVASGSGASIGSAEAAISSFSRDK